MSRFREGKLRFFNHDPSGPHVTRAIIDHVLITGGPVSGFPGTSGQLTATAYDASGNVIPGVSALWSSDRESVATVSLAGLVTLVGVGLATITATVDGRAYTTTASDLATAFNAIGGPTLRAMYIVGIGQTVVTDVTSPTGFYLTRWNNALNQNDGLHMRVNGENGNKGMPCLADGTPAGQGGIDVPAGTADPLVTGIAENFALSPAVVGSTDMQQFLNPRTVGIQPFGFGKIRNNTRIFQIGNDGDPNQVIFAGDILNNIPALANAGIGGLLQAQGSTPTFYAQHINVTSGQGNNTFGQVRVGRAFYVDQNVGTNINQLAANRRFAILPNGSGWTADTETPQYCIGVPSGRMEGAHVKLLCDWAETQPWGVGLWRDPRIQLRFYGDSYEPADVIDTATMVYGDGALVPAIAASVALSDVARGGNTQGTFQYGFHYYAADMDTTYTPAVYHRTGEWLNQGSTPAALQDNLLACQAIKALGPKHKVMLYSIRNEDSATDANGDRAWMAAHVVQDGYADYYTDVNARGVGWSPYQWNGGAPNKLVQFWKDAGSDSAQHPNALGQRYLLNIHRVDFELMLGLDISTHTYLITFPSEHLDLDTSTTPTGTVTGTAVSRSGGTLTKTIVYTSTNTGVATVNSSTGFVTAVGRGQCAIEASIAGELARGVCVINVTGPILLHTFTAADATNAVPNADTGQVAIIRGGTFSHWGIRSNQLYHSQDSTTGHDGVVFETGVSDCTVSSALSTAKPNQQVRFRDSGDTDYLRLWYDNGNFLFLNKCVAGTDSNLAGVAYTAADGDVLEAVLSGSTITGRVRRGGSILLSLSPVTETFNQTATKHGVGDIQFSALANWDVLKVQ